jgi:hypothetical protein
VWLQHFLSAAFARLPFASPQQCCQMVLALAKLGQVGARVVGRGRA